MAYYKHNNLSDAVPQLQTIRDVSPAATSSKAQNILDESKSSLLTRDMIAHIRYATVGDISVENVHPFQRELFGVDFVFAHNGDVPIVKDEDLRLGSIKSKILFKPEGRTDSEQVFCAIMNGLNAKFSSFPSLAELYSTIEELCLELVQKYEGTILNFLLGCGEGIQFAFSWPGSRPGSNTWNGLFYKQVDDDSKFPGMEDENSKENGQVAIIATQPLTNDESSWVELMRGDLLLFCNGQVFTSHTDLSR